MKKHVEKFDKRHLELSSFVSFLMGFTQAVTIYILSSYFKEAAGTENVGVFYALSYLVVLFILLNFHQVVRKIGKSNAYYFSVIAKIIIVAGPAKDTSASPHLGCLKFLGLIGTGFAQPITKPPSI